MENNMNNQQNCAPLHRLPHKRQMERVKEWKEYSDKINFVNQICDNCNDRCKGCHDTCHVRSNLNAMLSNESIAIYSHSSFIRLSECHAHHV